MKLREEETLFLVTEGLKVPKYGQAELVGSRDFDSAYQEFQSMLTRGRIDIFMVGEFG